jgi:hypothetical protein
MSFCIDARRLPDQYECNIGTLDGGYTRGGVCGRPQHSRTRRRGEDETFLLNHQQLGGQPAS